MIHRRRLMMARKSDWLNDEVTSAASAVLLQVTVTALQPAWQAPVTPVYVSVDCAVDAPASSSGVPEALERLTSRSNISTVCPVSAVQPASVHDTLASRDHCITKTSSQFLPLSVSLFVFTSLYSPQDSSECLDFFPRPRPRSARLYLPGGRQEGG